MENEFVVFNEHGQGVEWIDPVRGIEETDEEWIVHNGYHEYRIPRLPGYTCEIRVRDQG